MNREVAVGLAQTGVRRQFVAVASGSKLKGNTAKITNACVLLMKFLAAPDTNILIVIIGLTKIKNSCGNYLEVA